LIWIYPFTACTYGFNPREMERSERSLNLLKEISIVWGQVTPSYV